MGSAGRDNTTYFKLRYIPYYSLYYDPVHPSPAAFVLNRVDVSEGPNSSCRLRYLSNDMASLCVFMSIPEAMSGCRSEGYCMGGWSGARWRSYGDRLTRFHYVIGEIRLTNYFIGRDGMDWVQLKYRATMVHCYSTAPMFLVQYDKFFLQDATRLNLVVVPVRFMGLT